MTTMGFDVMPDRDLLIDTEGTDDSILTFDDGIPGFPSSRRFVLEALSADSDFRILQSLDEPTVSMVVTYPWAFFPDYAPELEERDRRDLDLDDAGDAVVFCPVTLDAASRQVYLNLMGPFVVNARTRAGRQVVLSGTDLPVRAAVSLED